MRTPLGGRAINKLSELAIKSFVAKARAGKAPKKKFFDGGGMYLTLTRAGTPVWRFKYRFGGKEKLYSIGIHGEVTLEKARLKRDELRGLLRDGRDPLQARDLEKAEAVASAGNTFQQVAEAWLAHKKPEWSHVHYTKSKRAIERDVLPQLGKLPIAAIKPVMIASVIKSVGRRARDTAAKVLWHVTGIFRYAQAHGMRHDNPAEPAAEVLPRRKLSAGYAAFLKFDELGDVLRRADAARLSSSVRIAHRLCAFTAARISNVVQAEWSEFHLDVEIPMWVIPRAKMKARDRLHDHKVVLCPEIAGELRKWRQETGGKGFVFPARNDPRKYVTREALEKVYRVTLGLEGKHSPHGWRKALSTLARDEGNFERDVVELALDHVHDTEVVRAYDRGERLARRVALMRWWGEQLVLAQGKKATVAAESGRGVYRVDFSRRRAGRGHTLGRKAAVQAG